MKKRKMQKQFSDRWLYTFIVLGILMIIGIGVYAYAPSGAGHNYWENSFCAGNKILKMNSAGTNWTCADAAGGTDGTNCATGQYAKGVDANGNAQGCASDVDTDTDTSTCQWVALGTSDSATGEQKCATVGKTCMFVASPAGGEDDGGNPSTGTISKTEYMTGCKFGSNNNYRDAFCCK